MDKISSKFGEPDTAVKKIFDKVVDTDTIDPGRIELDADEQKPNYRVDKLSKLDKEQRKFLSKIFEIINDVLDKKTAENLLKKIEEELK